MKKGTEIWFQCKLCKLDALSLSFALTLSHSVICTAISALAAIAADGKWTVVAELCVKRGPGCRLLPLATCTRHSEQQSSSFSDSINSSAPAAAAAIGLLLCLTFSLSLSLGTKLSRPFAPYFAASRNISVSGDLLLLLLPLLLELDLCKRAQGLLLPFNERGICPLDQSSQVKSVAGWLASRQMRLLLLLLLVWLLVHTPKVLLLPRDSDQAKAKAKARKRLAIFPLLFSRLFSPIASITGDGTDEWRYYMPSSFYINCYYLGPLMCCSMCCALCSVLLILRAPFWLADLAVAAAEAAAAATTTATLSRSQSGESN